MTISTDPQELLDSATRIAARYMGEERAEEFGRRDAVEGELVVRLRAEHVLAVSASPTERGAGAPLVRPPPHGRGSPFAAATAPF